MYINFYGLLYDLCERSKQADEDDFAKELAGFALRSCMRLYKLIVVKTCEINQLFAYLCMQQFDF